MRNNDNGEIVEVIMVGNSAFEVTGKNYFGNLYSPDKEIKHYTILSEDQTLDEYKNYQELYNPEFKAKIASKNATYEHRLIDDMVASETGSLRSNKGKLPMHLVPQDAIIAMAAVLEKGMQKYSARNWELGNKLSVPYSSLMRHLMAYWGGEDNDSESGLPHTYHILMNAAMLVRYEKDENNDDRPKDL